MAPTIGRLSASERPRQPPTFTKKGIPHAATDPAQIGARLTPLPSALFHGTLALFRPARPGGLRRLDEVGTAAALNVAINDFNAQAGPCAFTITLSNDIALTASTPPISNSNVGAALTIDGMGHTVNGQDISGVRPFTIDSGTTVTLEEITITRGKVDNALGGGGISTDGTLTLMDSTVIDNATIGDGGGIYQNGGTLTLIGSSVIANTGGFSAAGIYQNAGTLTVTDSTITDNIGVTIGGGIYSAAGTATVTNSTLARNGAIFGGGIYNEGSLTVRDSEFTANRSVTGGGGIYNLGTLDVRTTTFSSNVAGTTIEGIRQRRRHILPKARDHRDQHLHRQSRPNRWWRHPPRRGRPERDRQHLYRQSSTIGRRSAQCRHGHGDQQHLFRQYRQLCRRRYLQPRNSDVDQQYGCRQLGCSKPRRRCRDQRLRRQRYAESEE